MKKIVIEWTATEGGGVFAHFPEPFPMSDHEWAAFAGLFDRLGFVLQNDGDTRSVNRADMRTRIVEGLEALGYTVDQREA